MTGDSSPDFTPHSLSGQELIDRGGSIHRAILAATIGMPGVAKDGELTLGTNTIGYRKIEDIRNALNPVLIQFGLVSYPRLLHQRTWLQEGSEPMSAVQWEEVEVDGRKVKRVLDTGREIRDGRLVKTRVWSEVEYEMRFVYVGDNSETTASAAGFAYDTDSDKSLSKASTVAIKRILNEVFKIGDPTEIDPDGIGEDERNRPRTTAELNGEQSRAGTDRGGQNIAAAKDQAITGTSRRSAEQPSETAVANADPATGEVADEPKPDRLQAAKDRVRIAVGKLQARDGADAWDRNKVDEVAAEVTGKPTREQWFVLPTAIEKLAKHLEGALEPNA